MPTPNASPTPSGQPATPADPKGPATSQVPPEKPVETPDAPKPTNPLEGELAAKFGDEWAKLTPKGKEALLAAEMKVRDADKKYQLIAKIQKDYELSNRQMTQLVQTLKDDPMAILSNPALGHDVHALAEKIVWDKIQEQRLSPEQRKLKELEAENARFKSAQDAAEKQRKELEQQQAAEGRRKYWEGAFIETIKKHNMPNDPRVIAQMAYNVKLLHREGKPVDMDWVANKTRQDFISWTNSWLLNTTEEQIPDMVPEEFVKKLRKWDLARLRARGQAPKPGPRPKDESVQKKANGKLTMSEWLDQRDQRLGRR